MKFTFGLTFLAALLLASNSVSADLIIIEPDNYEHGEMLNYVDPRVELAIHDGILVPNFPEDFGTFPDPDIIPVTALTNEDTRGGYFTSTGTKSFGHYLIGFTPLSRSIAMRFNTQVDAISIDVIGHSDLSATVGVLEIFDAAGNMLDSVESRQLFRQDVDELSISWSGSNVGYARAYSHTEHSPFGRFDNLRINAVPEPSMGLLIPVVGATVYLIRRRKQKTASK